jgi:hypothetical protein
MHRPGLGQSVSPYHAQARAGANCEPGWAGGMGERGAGSKGGQRCGSAAACDRARVWCGGVAGRWSRGLVCCGAAHSKPEVKAALGAAGGGGSAAAAKDAAGGKTDAPAAGKAKAASKASKPDKAAAAKAEKEVKGDKGVKRTSGAADGPKPAAKKARTEAGCPAAAAVGEGAAAGGEGGYRLRLDFLLTREGLLVRPWLALLLLLPPALRPADPLHRADRPPPLSAAAAPHGPPAQRQPPSPRAAESFHAFAFLQSKSKRECQGPTCRAARPAAHLARPGRMGGPGGGGGGRGRRRGVRPRAGQAQAQGQGRLGRAHRQVSGPPRGRPLACPCS